jgi:hypothetical protein
MKILDVDIRCNTVKFYLGEDSLGNWCGDDWDDAPFEHNAGAIYREYVEAEAVFAFDWDDIVFGAEAGFNNSPWSKNDLKARKVYALCVLKAEDRSDDELWRAWDIAADDRAHRFFLGDTWDESKIPGVKLGFDVMVVPP